MKDEEVLRLLRDAFAGCCRPSHFTDYSHCEECAEHDALLRSRDHDTLCLADVGNVGWDPICFISPAGFVYYFPTLARLAFAPPEAAYGWYFEQLLFHLQSDELGKLRWQHCSSAQRCAIVLFLRHVVDTRSELLEQYVSVQDTRQALELWAES